MADKRKLNRRQFTYYMQVLDDATKQIVGYLSDISTGGFDVRGRGPGQGRRRGGLHRNSSGGGHQPTSREIDRSGIRSHPGRCRDS